MSAAKFSKAPSGGAAPPSFARAIAELDRQMSLPAGHPEVLAAFERSGQGRLIVPAALGVDGANELVRLAREGAACGSGCGAWCSVCGRLSTESEAERGDSLPMCAACSAEAADLGEDTP